MGKFNVKHYKNNAILLKTVNNFHKNKNSTKFLTFAIKIVDRNA